MTYSEGRQHFPDPASRREHLQVINVYTHAQASLTPYSQAPADAVNLGMAPLLSGQDIPLLGESVTLDDNPDLLDE